MRLYTTVLLACTVTFPAYANTDAGIGVTEQNYPEGVKARVETSPFQQYNLHAQCARLAQLAGLKRASAFHLATAKRIKPKGLLDSDISYRYGFVDGRLTTLKAARNHTQTIEQIAKSVHEKVCPAMM